LLVAKEQEKGGVALRLYNLSCTSAAQMFDAILEAVLNHPGWSGCNGCRGQGAAAHDRCPIWENYSRLKQPLMQERLRNLLELCDQNESHLPIRQLLLLVSNVLLGHSQAKDGLMRCQDIPSIVSQERTALACLHSNVFGENLTPSRRENTEV